MEKIKKLCLIFILILSAYFLSCLSYTKDIGDPSYSKNKKFLNVDKEAVEVFRVLFTSENYIVSQMKFSDTIQRVDDPSGDKYMCAELKKWDMINESREGIIRVSLYPDMPGRIMQVRPQKLTYLSDIEKILIEDIQRWNFNFPKKIVSPTKFDVRYKVILRKKVTDEEIIKEVQKKMLENR